MVRNVNQITRSETNVRRHEVLRKIVRKKLNAFEVPVELILKMMIKWAENMTWNYIGRKKKQMKMKSNNANINISFNINNNNMTIKKKSDEEKGWKMTYRYFMPFVLRIRLPRLRFKDEKASWSQLSIHPFEKSLQSIIAPIQVDPFRYTEADNCIKLRSIFVQIFIRVYNIIFCFNKKARSSLAFGCLLRNL